MLLSIVTTLYRSESFINEFYARIKTCADKITPNYEIIFVDDGSDDNSLTVAKNIANTDPKVIVIELSKNFGHHRAMMTGLSQAQGEMIFLLDSDLEEEPEYLPQFYQKMHETEADVIYGVQDKRKGGWFEKFSGWVYYKLVEHFCEVKIPKNLTTLRLMNKNYVKSLLLHNEYILNITFLWTLTGFKQIPLTIQKHSKGSSQYTFKKKLILFSDTIISFSDKPLIYIFKFGLLISSLALLFILYIVSRKLIYNSIVSGWTSTIISIWFFGGVILFALGLIGIYIRKILLEVKNRPNSIIRAVYRNLVKEI
jgi:putative glycosyltransferase